MKHGASGCRNRGALVNIPDGMAWFQPSSPHGMGHTGSQLSPQRHEGRDADAMAVAWRRWDVAAMAVAWMVTRTATRVSPPALEPPPGTSPATEGCNRLNEWLHRGTKYYKVFF